MDNRIRFYRQLRGLRLRELAERIGTTPQSVSRLETGNMTLSVEWLERLAGALDVKPGDLLEQSDRGAVPLIGLAEPDGRVLEGPHGTFGLHMPAQDPVAVRLSAPIGEFKAGEILVGDRHYDMSPDDFDGQEAIVEVSVGDVRIVRLAQPAPDRFGATLVPIGIGPVVFDAHLNWVAPLVMTVRYW